MAAHCLPKWKPASHSLALKVEHFPGKQIFVEPPLYSNCLPISLALKMFRNLGVPSKWMVCSIISSRTIWKTKFNYIVSRVLKIKIQPQVKTGKQKNLSSHTTPSNTLRYSMSSVGSWSSWLKGLQKLISQGCRKVIEIDNPYKQCLCESVCVLKIVHFVN